MLYLPYSHFDYTDSWEEIQILGREVIDMDDDRLVDECIGGNIGTDEITDTIIERYEAYGMPITRSDRNHLIGYYILTRLEEVLEI